MKQIQKIRKASQLVFLGLLLLGLFMGVRLSVIFLLPATFIVGNFFCGWVCPYGTMQ